MDVKQTRRATIAQTLNGIKASLADGVNVARIDEAKRLLMELCEQKHLFERKDFPVAQGRIDTTYLVHEDTDGGYALYVNSSFPGQSSAPHDHGGAWAIVAAVVGEETHRLYVPENADGDRVRQVGELTVRPGAAVSMLADGIHAIEAKGTTPLIHLHLYAKSFERQAERRQFDLAEGTVRKFVLEDVGYIVDAR